MEMYYYTPSMPSSFAGLNAFQRETKHNIKDTKSWLSSQDAYTLHKPIRRKFKRRATYAFGVDHLWQADLADFSSLSRYNDGYRFVLVVIDVFSKFCWLRKLKDKSSLSIRDAFHDILLNSLRKPVYVQSDLGKEFVNSIFQEFLKRNGIRFYTSRNYDIKCSVVERLIRTLKGKLYRYMTYTNASRYVDVLQDIAKSYNSSFHSTIKRSPESVGIHCETKLLQQMYPKKRKTKLVIKSHELNVGDIVRLSQNLRRFQKGYRSGWTKETFIISTKLPTTPITYKVKDINGESIEGAFYSQELQKVKQSEEIDNTSTALLPNDLYIIEKIIKTRKRNGKIQHLVRWKGYSSEHDSWVDKLLDVSHIN